ncbi:MAG: GTP-binding protein, partial [Myxococcota bacterium]
VADLLVDQVEFADVIILNKLDRVTKDQALEVEAIIKTLNPRAKTIMATNSQVPLECVLDTGAFDYEEAASSAGWMRELEGEHVPESEEYGISSFTYRSPRPFDAHKFSAFLQDRSNWRGVLRSKGFFWVSADHRVAYEWAQAGGVGRVDPLGQWWASIPRAHWTHPEGSRPDQLEGWHEQFGDRAQQLVFIGQQLDEAALRARLDACLVDERALPGSPSSWELTANPFPPLCNG